MSLVFVSALNIPNGEVTLNAELSEPNHHQEPR
jgi:hypothetical protein